MPRNKVKIAYIEKRDQRKASFNKRKDSLFKKMNELSIFCDVKICAIIYSPYKKEVEIWPDDHDGVRNVINDFMKKSQIAKEKKTNTQESSIKKKSNKVMEQINKQKLENREIEMTNMMVEYLSEKVLSLNATDLKDLASFVGQKVLQVDERLELLENGTNAPPPAPHESQMLQQQQEVMQGGNSNNAKDVVAEGSTDVNCYVPAVMENGGADLDEMETNGRNNPDWLKDLVKLDTDFDKLMIPFSDDST